MSDNEVGPERMPVGWASVLWGYDDGPVRLPSDGRPALSESWFPPANGLRVTTSLAVDPEAQITSEGYGDAAPADLAGAMEDGGGRPGFHRSDTVDVGIVLAGEIVLELDDEEITLRKGDVVIQNGNVHGWRPAGTEQCELAFVVLGARREHFVRRWWLAPGYTQSRVKCHR